MLNIHRFLSGTSNINSFLEVNQIRSIGANCAALSKSSNKSNRIKGSRIFKKAPNVKMDPQKNHAGAAACGSGSSKFAQNGLGTDVLKKQFNSSKNSSMQNTRNSFRQWEDIEPASSGQSAFSETIGGNVFTVMSYNILSQNLLETHSYLYTNHNRDALNWEFRLSRLKSEILHIRPDILCLQEVQADHLQMILDSLKELKFNHIFKKKTGNRTDGCAIFYNRNQFTLLERHSVEYYQPQIEQLNRDNVAIIAKMCLNSDPAACFVVATTHLLYNPRRQDVRLAQIQVLLAELDKISYNGYNTKNTQGRPKRLPIILTGDFNLKPWSAPHRLITYGSLHYSNLTARQLTNPMDQSSQLTGYKFLPPRLGITDNCQHFAHSRLVNTELANQNATDFEAFEQENLVNQHPELFESGRLTHSLNLTSVYSHKKPSGQWEATTFQERWVTVDYMFFSQHFGTSATKLKLLSRYTLPSVDECHAVGLIPNSQLGSDHLSLSAKFILISPKS